MDNPPSPLKQDSVDLADEIFASTPSARRRRLDLEQHQIPSDAGVFSLSSASEHFDSTDPPEMASLSSYAEQSSPVNLAVSEVLDLRVKKSEAEESMPLKISLFHPQSDINNVKKHQPLNFDFARLNLLFQGIQHVRSYSSIGSVMNWGYETSKSHSMDLCETEDVSERTSNRSRANSEGSHSLTRRSSCPEPDGGKEPIICYDPEPDGSREAVKEMLRNNDPRLTFVNDGAAIKNPFAVDRRLQIDYLTKLLCRTNAQNVYTCKACDRVASKLRSMQQHLLSHSSSKFNLCVQCLKGFNDKYDMKRHTRKHTQIKPYECPECGNCFSQRCSLEGHRRKIHKISLQFARNQRRETVRVCERCGFSCSDLEGILQHMEALHPDADLPRLKRQASKAARQYTQPSSSRLSELPMLRMDKHGIDDDNDEEDDYGVDDDMNNDGNLNFSVAQCLKPTFIGKEVGGKIGGLDAPFNKFGGKNT